MGAHLHHRHLRPGSLGFPEAALQFRRKKGGVGSNFAVARPAVVQSAQQSRGAAGSLHQMFNEMGGGGFAVGARYPHQGQLAGGKTIESRRHLGHGLGESLARHKQDRLLRQQLLRRQALPRLLGDQGGHRPCRQGLGHEATSIHAGSRHPQEEIPRLYLARVGTEAPDLHPLQGSLGQLRLDPSLVEQFGQSDPSSFHRCHSPQLCRLG